MIRKNKESVYKFLDDNSIDYKRYDCEHLNNMEECSAISNKIGALIFKNLFLQTRNKLKSYLFLISPEKKFKTAVVSKIINQSRLSFGDNNDLLEFLGVLPGAISPIGLFFDKENKVEVLIDSDLLKLDKLAMHPLENDSVFAISKNDLIEKIIKSSNHNYFVIDSKLLTI